MEKSFQKMSSFYSPPLRESNVPSWLKEADIGYKNDKKDEASIPDRRVLERWYQQINDIIHREGNGDVDHTNELEDLRDEIYAYLY